MPKLYIVLHGYILLVLFLEHFRQYFIFSYIIMFMHCTTITGLIMNIPAAQTQAWIGNTTIKKINRIFRWGNSYIPTIKYRLFLLSHVGIYISKHLIFFNVLVMTWCLNTLNIIFSNVLLNIFILLLQK